MYRLAKTGGKGAGLNWSVQRRLQFIEFRLFWQGGLNRRDLKAQFGISDQQASADIAAYQESAPGNCEYDRNGKVFVPGPDFKSMFGPPEAQGYLNELRSIDYRITTPEESWIGRIPSFGTVPYPKRSADAETLRTMLRAIDIGNALEINYQSLSRPEAIWRWITPHALGYDGHRWHARGFCHRRGDFRDFVLGRIFDIRGACPHDLDSGLDLEWAEEVQFEIGTHPRLPHEQRTAVEIDHRMTDGRLLLSVRAALAHYLMRWMRVDLDPAAVNPEQIQIILLNKDSVEHQQRSLKQRTIELVEAAGLERLGIR
jgi:hypothetical protein